MKLKFAAVLVLISLFFLGCCKEKEVPREIQRLYSSKPSDRNDAALALARCGSPLADKAVPKLIQLMYDENVGVQSAAAYALRQIDTPLARQALERATKRKG